MAGGPDPEAAAATDEAVEGGWLSPAAAEDLAAIDAALDRLAGRDRALMDGREAAVIARRLAAATSRAGVLTACLLPVVEGDGLWATGGARSFPLWVAAEHHLSVKTARAQVRLGRTLRDHLPATATAALAGEVTLEHAQVLAGLAPTTDQRREVLADPAQECNETFLVDQARTLPVDDLRMLTRAWAAAADPDADDRGYVQSCDREHLDLARCGDMIHLQGQLTVLHGQLLRTALEAITPVPAAGDERTAGQRRAQALADLAQVVLDQGLAGAGRAVRPRINVLISEPRFRALAEQTLARQNTPGPGARAGAAAHRRRPAHGLLRHPGRADRGRHGCGGAVPGRHPGLPAVAGLPLVRLGVQPVPVRRPLPGPGRRAGPNGRSPAPGGRRWWPGTGTASTPGAPHHRCCATATTSCTGPPTAPPRSATGSCCASTTTTSSTDAASPSTATSPRSSSSTATAMPINPDHDHRILRM